MRHLCNIAFFHQIFRNAYNTACVNSIIINKKPYTYPFNPFFYVINRKIIWNISQTQWIWLSVRVFWLESIDFYYTINRKNYYLHCSVDLNNFSFLFYLLILGEYIASALIAVSSKLSVGPSPKIRISIFFVVSMSCWTIVHSKSNINVEQPQTDNHLEENLYLNLQDYGSSLKTKPKLTISY